MLITGSRGISQPEGNRDEHCSISFSSRFLLSTLFFLFLLLLRRPLYIILLNYILLLFLFDFFTIAYKEGVERDREKNKIRKLVTTNHGSI